MSYALSQRGADRHPLGLSVVIGAHALLAAVLVTSRIAATHPQVDPPVTLLPPPPPVVDKVEPTKTPDPSRPQLTQPKIVVPVIDDDRRPPTPVVADEDKGDRKPPPPVEIARVDPPAKKVERSLAHAAVINAGAAQCRPEYPGAALRASATGVSKIRFTIDAAGQVAAAQILDASGPSREHRMLDKAAAAALAQCPITVGTDETGRAIGTTVDVEYVWSMP